jgi:hypothetical protein
MPGPAIADQVPQWKSIVDALVDQIIRSDRIPVSAGRHLLAVLNEEGRDLDASSYWLARYRPMRDGMPAAILFHRPRIATFFWATMDEIQPVLVQHKSPLMSAEWLDSLCGTLAWGILAHEQFHFVSDLRRYAVKAPEESSEERHQRRLQEEALATAWEWRACRAYAHEADVPPELLDLAMHFWFRKITAPGYRDWRRYGLNDPLFLSTAAHLHTHLFQPDMLIPKGHHATCCDYWIIEDIPMTYRRPQTWVGAELGADELLDRALELGFDEEFPETNTSI